MVELVDTQDLKSCGQQCLCGFNSRPGHKQSVLINWNAFYFMHFVYILFSEKCNRFYIGFSSDIQARLEKHNAGLVTATRNCRPYVLKASKSFLSEEEARKEELRLKKAKNRKYLEWLIAGNW